MPDMELTDPAPPSTTVPTERSRLTVVVNPTKIEDLSAVKTLVGDVCRRHGWDEPHWVETTAEETGEKQARQAVDDGAQVVASLGGDGTVRAVAAALVGTDVALGLLPGGTGNLLARNLDLPVDEISDAVEELVQGRDRRVDVGVVRMLSSRAGPPGQGEPSAKARRQPPRDDVPDPLSTEVDDDEEIFLVMTGLGFDGEVMAGTNEKVKTVVGWPAYVFSALRRMSGRGFSVQVRARGESGVTDAPGHSVRRHARTVVIGNCGTLQGGIELMPEARVDDGVLDAVVVAPSGPFGWASVVGDIVTRHRAGHRRLDRLRGTEFSIRAVRPVEAEIDGDPMGEHDSLSVRMLPRALVVRVG